MSDQPEKPNDVFVIFFESLGDLFGKKIVGAAYSERGGDSVVTLNLIDENQVITAWHMPIDLPALKRGGK